MIYNNGIHIKMNKSIYLSTLTFFLLISLVSGTSFSVRSSEGELKEIENETNFNTLNIRFLANGNPFSVVKNQGVLNVLALDNEGKRVNINLRFREGVGRATYSRQRNFRKRLNVFVDFFEDNERITLVATGDLNFKINNINIGEDCVFCKKEKEEEIKEPEEPEEPEEIEESECIDINTASIEELVKIIHISQTRAEELINLRPFNSIDDLTRISGIGPASVNAIKEQGLVCAFNGEPQELFYDVRLIDETDNQEYIKGIRIRDRETGEILMDEKPVLFCDGDYEIRIRIVNLGAFVEKVNLFSYMVQNDEIIDTWTITPISDFETGISRDRSTSTQFNFSVLSTGIYEIIATAEIDGISDENPEDNTRKREIELIC